MDAHSFAVWADQRLGHLQFLWLGGGGDGPEPRNEQIVFREKLSLQGERLDDLPIDLARGAVLGRPLALESETGPLNPQQGALQKAPTQKAEVCLIVEGATPLVCVCPRA